MLYLSGLPRVPIVEFFWPPESSFWKADEAEYLGRVDPPVAGAGLSGKLEKCSDRVYVTGQRSVVGIVTTVS